MASISKRMCSSNEEDTELRRGPWTLEEDTLLTHYIALHGEGRWNMLAKYAGLKRTGKSCRLRWLNYLKPDIKRGNLTPQEQLLILELHSKWGNRWSKIARYLPGRTDNEIKNYWRTRVQRQARQLNIESNSKKFIDAVRCFWMPRLLQKVEQAHDDYPQNLAVSSASSVPNFTPPSPFSSESFPPQMNKFSMAHYSNLDQEHSSTSSRVISTESEAIIPHQLQILENNPPTPSVVDDHTVYDNLILSHQSNYCGDIDMDGFYPPAASTMPEIGTFNDHSPAECQMALGNWIYDDDMVDSLWNMDDIWQFSL